MTKIEELEEKSEQYSKEYCDQDWTAFNDLGFAKMAREVMFPAHSLDYIPETKAFKKAYKKIKKIAFKAREYYYDTEGTNC